MNNFINKITNHDMKIRFETCPLVGSVYTTEIENSALTRTWIKEIEKFGNI